MNKEPFLRMSKRESICWRQVALIYIVAILLALVVCAGVIFALVRMNPIDIYKAIFDGALGTKRRIWITVRDMLILLCVGIGLAPAFRMRFWNIGAEGQILVGGVATAAVMINLGGRIPNALLILLMLAAAAVAGLLWGLIPTFFKSKWRTNETLFTLMMNYVAMQVVTFCIIFWENPKGSNTVGIINQSTRAGWLPAVFGNDYFWIIVIVGVLTVFMFVYLRYGKHGYEIAVVGESEQTARYAGISVKKVMLRTMALSAAICGIAGFLIVSGSGHTISTSTADGRGFTAIIVAWLSKLNPFAMILIAFGITFMDKGAIQIASQYGLNENASDVLVGIILFFVLGAEFFVNYKIERGHKQEETK